MIGNIFALLCVLAYVLSFVLTSNHKNLNIYALFSKRKTNKLMIIRVKSLSFI